MKMPTILAVQRATVQLNPGIYVRDLISSDTAHRISHPRQDAMAAAREMGKLSFPAIARQFGGKHHSTVMHGVNRANKLRPAKVAAIIELAKKIMAKGSTK